MFWVDRIALFQQNGSRLEMFQGAVSQKNMCKERRVIQGLLLIAVFTAKQGEKVLHRRSHFSVLAQAV